MAGQWVVVAQSAQRGTFSSANGAEDARRVKLVRASSNLCLELLK
jgi:hypothetical protein